jgi:hypothetical protein
MPRGPPVVPGRGSFEGHRIREDGVRNIIVRVGGLDGDETGSPGRGLADWGALLSYVCGGGP